MNKNLFILILSMTVIALLASCYTQKKAVKQLNNAYNNYPDTTAKLTRTWFPCIVTEKETVTKIDTIYDIIDVRCPDSVQYVVDSFETIEAVRVPVYVKVKQPRIVETREVTIRIKDSATVFICEQELTKSVKTINDLSKQVKRKNKALLWLWIVVVGFTLYYLRKPIARALKIPL